MQTAPWMNIYEILLSEKKVNLNSYILYNSILCNNLEVTTFIEIEKRLVVTRVKEEVGLEGKWVRLHMREPVVTEQLCVLTISMSTFCLYIVQQFCRLLPLASLMPQVVKNPLQSGTPGFNPWVRKICWRKAWQPTPVFLPGEAHGQRNLAGYRVWQESDVTEWLSTAQYCWLTPSKGSVGFLCIVSWNCI